MFWPLAGFLSPPISRQFCVAVEGLWKLRYLGGRVCLPGAASGSGFFLSQQIKETNPKENADQREPRDVKVFDCMGRYVCCLLSGSQLLLQSGSGQW